MAPHLGPPVNDVLVAVDFALHILLLAFLPKTVGGADRRVRFARHLLPLLTVVEEELHMLHAFVTLPV
jgi:hypothetical protein